MKKTTEHIIKEVIPGSIAQELELAPGDVLVSVNGEQIEDVFDYLKECPHLIVKGLMMMAPHIDSNDTAVYFKQTKELFDQLNCKYSEFEMTELSMGMSNDYHEALKYGATMIRVGSALFE